VGRDVLGGCMTGVGLMLLYHGLILGWTWATGSTPAPDANVSGPTLSALRHVAFRLLVNAYSSVLFALVLLFVLVLLRVLLRSTILAGLVFCLVAAGPIRHESAVFVALFWGARALVVLLTLMRGGLLRLAVTLFVLFSLLEAPLTLDLSAWYLPHALPTVIAIACLAGYGFRTSLAGKPAFGGLLED
jgi:hypothetical protein